MIKNLDKYKESFLSEARELIGIMNKSLLKLEKNPSQMEFVNDIFRRVHTLKGMADTMDFQRTVQLCHTLEDVLDMIKKKEVKVDRVVDVLFECFDTLEETLKRLKEGKTEADNQEFLAKLAAIKSAEVITENRKHKDKVPAASAEFSVPSADAKLTSIEVKVERLDLLMNLAEELLIAKMRLDIVKEDLQNSELTAVTDTFGRLITDIQFNIMQARMVPVGFVFNRFPRMVRDVARNQGKEVNLKLEGTDIELDRLVIDEIGECLIHLLRNAIDHGIETPEERKKTGKPGQGTIKLKALRTKNSAVFEISDDGAGFDFEEIKKVAVKRGLFSEKASHAEVLASIFLGLSTTKVVSAVSGRGFGLNIVKSKIESLGGSIKINSTLDRGTQFLIEVPLTLAVIKVLFVRVAGKLFALPLTSIERLIAVKKEDLKGVMNFEAIVLNEGEIPITRLGVLFDETALEHEEQLIAIIKRGNEKLGVVVDGFMNTQEIVVKPLNKLISESKYFSGTTIIGSGEVVLILDVANLMLTKRPASTESVASIAA